VKPIVGEIFIELGKQSWIQKSRKSRYLAGSLSKD